MPSTEFATAFDPRFLNSISAQLTEVLGHGSVGLEQYQFHAALSSLDWPRSAETYQIFRLAHSSDQHLSKQTLEPLSPPLGCKIQIGSRGASALEDIVYAAD
jgi:hypothetical protein